MPSHRRNQKTEAMTVIPPERQVGIITFECSLPTDEPALTRIQDPLPFSTTISKNLALAAAFIDHAGHLAQEYGSGYELLEKRLHAAIDTIGNDAIELTLLREQLREQTTALELLEVTASGQEKANQDFEDRMAENRAASLKAEKELARKLRITEKALHKSQASENRLKEKLGRRVLEEHEAWVREREHDKEDHESIDAAHDALDQALQEKASLQAELDSKSEQLTSVSHELETAQERLSVCKHNCEEKDAEISTLTDQLASANRANTALYASVEDLNAQLTTKDQEISDINQSLADKATELAEVNESIVAKDGTITTLEAALANVKDERDQKIQLLEDVQKSAEETQSALQAKIEELSAHDLEDHQRMEAAEEAKRISEESIKELQDRVDAARAQDEEAHRKLEAEEEAKRATEAELERVRLQLEEAKKPKLPNKVTLANPLPIVGSLSGASDDFDDIFYPLEAPFPVTIYGHSSTQVFVSINGVFSLDRGDAIFRYEALPCRNRNLPEYSLFPFWCDLFIYKGTPQGIYYEAAGEAPSRTFCVEWYVSRYQDKDQYYHFNMLLEEARPNVVTYKFYEALDRGGACTIGAQGPDSAQMFSYNEAKALPGVQVVIDTASGSLTESTFPIQE
ncbi:hypothetical protein BGZ61DRAFT_516912 [Ilyonectria robusta]|uniref:uncharacterized protein n=1 Tax=Ilyonectria robusta TaxID=1079257 RepID=UPI001E8D5B16|nr:uncharacterized protein BGZ61DRAFT_516912 [Ilyonectria robusta]KAH8706196.1 hypothetical protein BGZ61DRAFT_516912 [Ilyonectria robusta]